MSCCVSLSCGDLPVEMQVLTCEKKVCWVSALADSIIHCISELGGMPDTKAPNDQEVLFESVALGFILYIFFFPFCNCSKDNSITEGGIIRWNVFCWGEKEYTDDFDFTHLFLSLQICHPTQKIIIGVSDVSVRDIYLFSHVSLFSSNWSFTNITPQQLPFVYKLYNSER